MCNTLHVTACDTFVSTDLLSWEHTLISVGHYLSACDIDAALVADPRTIRLDGPSGATYPEFQFHAGALVGGAGREPGGLDGAERVDWWVRQRDGLSGASIATSVRAGLRFELAVGRVGYVSNVA